jgi:acetylornithine deacetylase/succinyl-diaminopimelate desuccinylase-like protein
MKGGVASMIAAARSLAQSGLASGRVIVAAVADEEYASIGAAAVVKRWRADGAVVLEPSDIEIGIAHKGFSWVEISTEGIAAHGSRPLEGRDAILRMGRVLSGLESLNRDLQSKPPHPLVGNASLHASLITGGRELSTYPDRCTLQLERRTISGESAETALTEVHQILDQLKSEDPEFRAHARFLFGQPPYEIPKDHDLPSILQSELARHNRAVKSSGMTFWTDAAILAQAGIPSVIFGPGGGGIHGLEEYVRTEEVLVCRDVLIDATRAFCAS